MRHGLLAAYDAQLRESVETSDFDDVRTDGPLWIARMPSRGFVTYRSLSGVTAVELDALISRTVSSFSADPQIEEFEWKTRDHDGPPNLGALLIGYGLRPQERETVMAGAIEGLAGHDPLPEGVELHRAGDRGDLRSDVERVVEFQNSVFGPIPRMVEMTLRRLASPYVDLWFAEADGEVIGSGRLDRVPGTDFAGLWGGAIRENWRRHGVYRALTQARARYAQAEGARYLYADCTVMSRVILESCGLIPITTTVPYIWHRNGSALPQQ
jgi:N-acetylglutamate synthase-like GNAT family acetyltransferase